MPDDRTPPPALEPSDWTLSDEDPDIAWSTAGGKSAIVCREIRQVSSSADYDLPHTLEHHAWHVQDDATGKTLSSGSSPGARRARRSALDALNALNSGSLQD